MNIELTKIQNTPVFYVESDRPEFGRIFGAVWFAKLNRWVFPAYPPALAKVLYDIDVVYNNISMSTEAQAHVDSTGSLEQSLQIAQEFNDNVSPLKGYQHQIEGLAELLYNYRWALKWEMGTGKTKVAVDAMCIQRPVSLVLCPLIAVSNWCDEVALHSNGTLTSQGLVGSRQRKLKILTHHSDVDVLVVPYDTAKLYGTPHLHPPTLKALKDARIRPTPSLRQHASRVNDTKIQVRLVTDWVKGRKVRDIGLEVEELVEGTRQWISERPFDVLVADESHRIKTPSSQRTRAFAKLAALAVKRYWLTGTMVLNDPRDLYSQLKYLARAYMPEDWEKFNARFVDFSPYNSYMVTGYKNLHVLNKRVGEISSERYLEDCVDLPGRVDKDINFELSPAQMRDYNQLLIHKVLELPGMPTMELESGAIRMIKHLQICSGFVYAKDLDSVCDACPKLNDCVASSIYPGTDDCTNPEAVAKSERLVFRYPDNPKLNTLKDLLVDILEDSERKVIIWAVSIQELDDIVELLNKENYGHVRVDGSTTSKIRELAKEFNTNKKCRVYLGQISTGIAITLVSASHMVYYSRNWKLEDWEQSRGRNYRIGQTRKVVVYRLIARGSVEQKQLKALDQRKDLSKTLTKRVNCFTCSEYDKCLDKEILPWSKGCILSSSVSRTQTRIGIIKPRKEFP